MAANVHVILARDVPNLGRIGELVQVRPGYMRNFLVPKGLALPASPKRVAEFVAEADRDFAAVFDYGVQR